MSNGNGGSETTRETTMIRIRNPKNHHQYVDVKVINSISFTSPQEASQQYVFRFNNHEDGNFENFRKVHKQTVTGSDHKSKVDVERIDAWGVTHPQDSFQQIGWRMTGNVQEPPTHFKTHKFKITNPHQKDSWVVMQRIDEISFIDMKDKASNNDSMIPLSNSDHDDPTGGWTGQETRYRINWPDDDMSDPTHLNTDDDNTSINPPYRFDPFQDLIDVHWGGHHSLHFPPPPPHPPGGPLDCQQYLCIYGVGVLWGCDTDRDYGGIDFIQRTLNLWLPYIEPGDGITGSGGAEGVASASPGSMVTLSGPEPCCPLQEVNGCICSVTVGPAPQFGDIATTTTTTMAVWLMTYNYCLVCRGGNTGDNSPFPTPNGLPPGTPSSHYGQPVATDQNGKNVTIDYVQAPNTPHT